MGKKLYVVHDGFRIHGVGKSQPNAIVTAMKSKSMEMNSKCFDGLHGDDCGCLVGMKISHIDEVEYKKLCAAPSMPYVVEGGFIKYKLNVVKKSVDLANDAGYLAESVGNNG